MTNEHSKKRENHEVMLGLYYVWCRVHSTLKSTPAVAAGLTTETWSIEKPLVEVAKTEREFATIN